MDIRTINMRIIDRIRELAEVSGAGADESRWLALGANTQDDPDYLPISVVGDARPHLSELPEVSFALADQIEDLEKMLACELARVLGLVMWPGDQTLCVAPRFGNSFLLTALGLEVKLIDNACWPARHLSWDEACDLVAPDSLTEGTGNLLGRAVEFVQFARSVLPPQIPTALFYMMSPYDLASLIVGDMQMLSGIYERPDDVHHLMGVCCDLFARATLLLKRETGEPHDFFRYNEFTLIGGGMLCEDCPIMLSPEMHREFCIPYTRKALDEIGGGQVHWCGDGRHLIDNYLEIPNLYGFQLGQLELNGPYEESVPRVMRAERCLRLTYPGAMRGRDWAGSCHRLLKPLTRRKFGYTVARPGEDGLGVREAWWKAQDECLREPS